jgi:FixJ family two-component response regulator
MADTKNATVFVIDDDTSVRRSLRRLLRLSGYEVEEFASADDFLERERPSGAGCVILDVRMPHMSGPQLFDHMAHSGYSLPVIFLTAHGDVPTGVHAMKDGAADFLLKPVDAESLLPAVGDAIRRHAEILTTERGRAAIEERLARLSPREREVMEHVVRGDPNKRIAGDLGISEKTVKAHRHRVMEKMEAGSLAELVRLADAASPRAAAKHRPRSRRPGAASADSRPSR